jgi:hypothetical protein
MPEWVTALEAAVLTGASETDVLQAVTSGRINASPISLGRGGNGVLMVRLADVQAMVDASAPPPPAPVTVTLPPAAPPPVATPPEPTAPSSNGVTSFDASTVWAEPADVAPPVVVEPVQTAPPVVVQPPVQPAPPAPAPVVEPTPIAPVVEPAPVVPVTAVAPPVAAPAPVAPLVEPTPIAPVAEPVPPAPIAEIVPTGPIASVAAAPAVAPAPAPAPPPVVLTPVPAPAESEFASPDTATGPTGLWGERPMPPVAIPVPVPESTRPRLRNPKTLAAAILALALLAAAVYVAQPGTLGKHKHVATGSLGAAPPSVVWAMPTAHGVQLAVVGLPKTGPGIALALPSETHVVLPAGDISTVGSSSGSGPRAQAVAQNVLLKRVGHYLVSTPASLSRLVDDLGGLDVDTEAPFTFNGHRLEAGTVKMTGAMALAYLSQANAEDVTGRWEDVIAAVLAAPSEPADWADVGASDDLAVVSRLLAASRGATVLEMPTAPATGGGVQPDRDGLASILTQFGTSLGNITRVVVVNGSGAPGLGTLIDGKLAPYGFSVLTSENAQHFDVRRTQIVASGEANLAAAEQAQKVLGVGTVKVTDQPTSLSDVTIIVGKDFSG